MADYLIWWTSQDDVQIIKQAGIPGNWPPYLKGEFSDRDGRNGRGRLWLAPELADEPACPLSAVWHDDNPLCRAAGNAGGIVIRASDSKYVGSLPGFVTTFRMQFVEKIN